MPIQIEPKTHVDLFAGIGSFAYCAKSLGLTTTESVEYVTSLLKVCTDKYKSKGYKDIVDFEMPKNRFLLTGGFPCQDISMNNRFSNLGLKGKKSGLWSHMLRCFNEGRPKYGIIENVENLRRRGLGQIIRDLANIGYDTTYTTIDSRFCGVPQRRRRVYICAFRDGIHRKADPLKFTERSKKELVEKIKAFKSDQNASTENYKRKSKFKYFTCQAFDCYQDLGVASSVIKSTRTDLVYHNRILRELSSREKLALQGFPRDYLSGYDLSTSEKYLATGMTIPVVKWVMKRVVDYDKEYG